MKKLLGFVLVTILILGGWSSNEQAKAGGSFYQKLDKISQSVNQSKWKQAATETTALRKLYKNNLWKLQLLADEGEYEGLNQELEKLSAAISARDKTQSKVQLAEVHSYLKSIYSL